MIIPFDLIIKCLHSGKALYQLSFKMETSIKILTAQKKNLSKPIVGFEPTFLDYKTSTLTKLS